jgi:hypothetical protein
MRTTHSPNSKITEGLSTAVTEAQEILKRLSHFNTLEHDDLLGGLSALMSLCSKGLKEFSELSSAITLCWRAEYYNLGKDPLIEEWASWPDRHAWLNLELHAVISKLTGTTEETDSTAKLQTLRKKYQDDGEGYPKDIWSKYDEHQARKDLAYGRSELYVMGEVLEYAETTGKLNLLEFTSMLLSWCSKFTTTDSGKELSLLLSELQACSRGERIPVAWRIYSHCLGSICSSEDSQYAALLGRPSEVVEDFYKNTRISLFDRNAPPSAHLWEELNQAQQAFREISAHFPVFEISELKQLFGEGRFDIVSLKYNRRFITAGLIMNDKSTFLPRTVEKLAKFGEVILSDLNVHTWQFLNVADPRALISLRHLRIDWSLILRDTITDISLMKGREDVLGIVELDNHAMKSHQRIGFTPLGDELLFKSDDGKAAAIQRRSLYNPFSE